MIEFMLLTDTGCFDFCARHVTLGRDRRCTFVLPDESVQDLHAVIAEHYGRLYIEKRHRDALTFVNRAPIYGRVELYDGDVVDIGPWTLTIRSRQLPRREGRMAPSDMSLDVTPSDPAIVRTIKLPRGRPGPIDDTSSSIIII